jgi:hypothetical protein
MKSNKVECMKRYNVELAERIVALLCVIRVF